MSSPKERTEEFLKNRGLLDENGNSTDDLLEFEKEEKPTIICNLKDCLKFGFVLHFNEELEIYSLESKNILISDKTIEGCIFKAHKITSIRDLRIKKLKK